MLVFDDIIAMIVRSILTLGGIFVNKNDFFCMVFYDELDSWFSADIICCDSCYEDFISRWAGINLRSFSFQKNSIDLKSFYSGSRLQDFFTEEDVNELIENIHCPRCGDAIGNHIFPYNYPFDLPDNIECDLEEIDKLSKETPFLLLSNPFAQKSFDSINELSKSTKRIIFDKEYYRARRFKKGKSYINMDFKYPPKDKISEGRYNHAGFAVIYLADSPSTCFYELRRPDEGIAIAKIKISKPLKILDLIEIEDDSDSIINVAAWSSLMSSPIGGDGWYNPQYTFTRFIADCAISAGFDAIKYPSVRLGDSYNIVILDGATIWRNLDITEIMEGYLINKEEIQ